MIRLADAAVLALTKLRARRIRTAVTIVIASLLFGMLFAVSLVARGVFASVEQFSQEAFGSRYIIQATTQTAPDYFTNKDVIANAEQIQKQTIAKKKAEAKRLGLPYQETAEQPVTTEGDGPNGKEKYLNPTAPAAQQAIGQYALANPTPGLANLQQMAKSTTGVKGFYQQLLSPTASGSQKHALQVLKDGNESYIQQQNQAFGQNGLDSFANGWSLMSDELLAPFVLPDVDLKLGKDGVIPVVAPYTAVEQLLKLQALPSKATPKQKLDRLSAVRDGAKSLQFQVCYRNASSAERVGIARSSIEELERGKTDKNFIKPDLSYGYPATPCGDITVVRDVRTADQKALAAKQDQFDQLFGKLPPSSTIMKFRVVGVAPDPFSVAGTGITDILRIFASSTLGQASWITPLSVQAKEPLIGQIFQPDPTSPGVPNSFFVELSSADASRKFISDNECKPDFSPEILTGGKDPFSGCVAQGKPFNLLPFGSNSLVLQDVKNGFQKVFFILTTIVAVIATIILMGLLGRMIADSRRETAVFRAIGAKRTDIVSIYLLYVVACIVLICIVAGLIGLALSQFVVARQEADFTVQALLIFNSQQLDQIFSLRSISLPDTVKLIGIVFAAGLASSLLPLARNIRRNPIKDMRDDT